jgi:tetratricopeptide (TPR) repeat protein
MKKATEKDLELSQPIELVILAVKRTAASCRVVGSDSVITLRATRLWNVVPGEIAVVQPRRQWTCAGHSYLSGEILSARLDPPALGLVPLRLEAMGMWLPDEHYWGEADEPIEAWAKPIIARGPREAFEMEQVIPGQDPDDFDSDPICEANDLWDAGHHAAAVKLLMELCQADLRCLDAHAHLGNLRFKYDPKDAIRNYLVGVRIGELSLAPDFDGLLPWGHIDNRPFLRCLHGYGLCLWRLGRFEDAGRVFGRMLWLNPTDNQGARFLIDDVSTKTAWEDSRYSA